MPVGNPAFSTAWGALAKRVPRLAHLGDTSPSLPLLRYLCNIAERGGCFALRPIETRAGRVSGMPRNAGSRAIRVLNARSFRLVVAASFALLLAVGPARAATTFSVNSTGDGSDANIVDTACDADASTEGRQCTLRAAIQESNDTPGADTIRFDIPGDGVQTIAPASPLDAIRETVTINGYTQPGASPNTLTRGNDAQLLIELDGTSAGGSFANGLTIEDARLCVVRGLVINRFGGRGIDVFNSTSTDADHRIEGNFIGTDASGTRDLGNGDAGVRVDASGNTIGGTSPATRNVISGNQDGIMFGGGGRNNTVLGNYVGTKKDGNSPLSNSFAGVAVFDFGNTVGGSTSAAANTIAFNGFAGVQVQDDSAPGNSILGNSIFSNGGLGIDLVTSFGETGPTPNDPKDPDTAGGNNLQNKPIVASATVSGERTTIEGRLNSTPGRTFTIQFFSNPVGNEGVTFLTRRNVTTDANGNASFAFSLARAIPAGQTITATATDALTGDTSEFSAARTVVRQQ